MQASTYFTVAKCCIVCECTVILCGIFLKTILFVLFLKVFMVIVLTKQEFNKSHDMIMEDYVAAKETHAKQVSDNSQRFVTLYKYYIGHCPCNVM